MTKKNNFLKLASFTKRKVPTKIENDCKNRGSSTKPFAINTIDSG